MKKSDLKASDSGKTNSKSIRSEVKSQKINSKKMKFMKNLVKSGKFAIFKKENVKRKKV